MTSYNLGTASGSIRITYNSRGAAEVDRDLRRVQDELREINERHVDIDIQDEDAQRTVHRVQESLEQLARERADPNITLDDAEFRERFRAIRDQLEEVNRAHADPSVTVSLSPTELEQVRALQSDLRDLDRTVADPRVDIDTALAETQLRELNREVSELDGREINIKIDVRDKARAAIALIGSTALTSAKYVGILELALAGLAAAEGIVAVLAAGIGIFGGAIAAAAAGTGIFGAAVVTNLKPAIEAYKNITKAQDAYNKATTDADRQKALQDMADSIANLDENQKELVTNVVKLKGAWKDLAATIQPEVFSITNSFLRATTKLLPQLAPLLKNTAGAYALLGTKIEQTATGPGTSKFLGFLARQAPTAILTFSHTLGALGGIFAHVFEGFEGLIAPAERALVGFVDRWLAKSKDLEKNPSFRKFIDFIKTTGPEVNAAFDSIGGAVADLVVALQPLVGPALQFVTRFFQAISKLTKSSGFKGFVGDVSDAIGTLGDIINGNASGVGDFLDTFGDAIKHVLEAIRPLIPHLVTFLDNMAKLIDKIVTSPGFAKLIQAIGEGLDKLGNALATIPPGVINTVFSAIAELVSLAADFASAAHGLGLLAAAIFVLGLRAGGAAGPLGTFTRGLGGLASRGVARLAVPVAVTYIAAKATGTEKSLEDLINGDFAKIPEDGPEWAKKLGASIGKAIGIGADWDKVTGDLSQQAIDALNGVKVSGDEVKIWDSVLKPQANTVAAAERDIAKAGDDGVNAYLRALERGGPQVQATVQQNLVDLYLRTLQRSIDPSHAAGEAVAKSTTDGMSTVDGTTPGTKGGTDFWSAVFGQRGNSQNAGTAVSTAVKLGLQFTGLPAGLAGALGFVSGVAGQAGASGGAGRANATAAERGLDFDGSGPGTRVGNSYAGGVSSQAGNAERAGAGVAASAGGGLASFDATQAGINLAESFASGMAARTGTVASAAAGLSAAARDRLYTGSPAKKGPLSTAKAAPDAMGGRIASGFAKGMREQLFQVIRASNDIADAAAPSALGAFTGAASATRGIRQGAAAVSAPTVVAGPRTSTFSPTYQYVGPTPDQVVKESAREFDWRYGS